MKNIVLVLLISLISSNCTSQSTSKDEIVVGKFDKILSTVFSSEQPGGTVLVSKKNEIIYHKAFGKANLELSIDMNTNHVFKIASNTKPFTAVAILKLVEEGKLSLNDDITDYLEDFTTQSEKITIKHLLTHTSGIYNYTNLKNFDSITRIDYSKKGLIDLIKNKPLDFSPGSQFKYCNTAYDLLGMIISKVTNMSYEAYLNTIFFEPLSMKNTYCKGPQGIIKNRTDGYLEHNNSYIKADYMSKVFETSPAGGLRSTVEDLFIWYNALMNGKLISKTTIQKATSPYILKNGKQNKTGYSWFLGNLLGSPFIWHEGSTMGYYSSIQYFPEEQIFIAALTNCNWKSKALHFAYAGQKIASVLLEKEYYKVSQLSEEQLYQFEAIFESKSGKQKTLVVVEGRLTLIEEGSRRPVSYYKNDSFYVEGANETLRYIRNKKNEIVQLTSTITSETIYTRTKKELPKKSFAQSAVNVMIQNGFDIGFEWINTFKNSDRYYITEDELNQAGYALLNAEKTKEALVFFELNTELFPNSQNVFDSLGEAYFKINNYKLSLINYQKVLRLDPKNENAKLMIKKISETLLHRK